MRPTTTTTEELYGTKPLGSRAYATEAGAGGGDGRGGAGGGDSYTRSMTEMRRRRKMAEGTWGKVPETLQVVSTTMMQPVVQEEQLLDGLYIPNNLHSVKSVSYVLNQHPGKLRIQDIQTVIDERNREAALREGRLEDALTLTNTLESSVVLDPLDDMSLSDDVKEGMFMLQLQEQEAHARRMEMGFTMQAIGEDLLSEDHCAGVRQARLDHHLIFNHNAEQEHAHRISPLLENGSLQMVSASTDPEVEPVSTSNRWDADKLGGEVEALEGLEDQEATWNPYQNDTWLKRAQTLDQFVRAGRVIMVRNRVQRRLTHIKNLLKGCNYNRDEIAALVLSEMLSAKDKAIERPGIPPSQLFNPQNVCPAPLPVYRKNMFKHRSPVQQNYVADFDLVDMMTAKVPIKFKLLGYEEEAWSPIPSYLPPLLEQPLMAGAEEESSGAAVPTAIVPSPESLPEMPECFLETPFESLPIADRFTDDRLIASSLPSWGATDSDKIQPAIFAHEDTTHTQDPASNGCRALRGIPMLSDSWVARKELWQVMDVEVPSLLYDTDPADRLKEDADDQMRPTVRPHVPTEDEIRALLVTDADISSEPPVIESQAPPPPEEKAGKSGKGGKGGKGASDGNKGSKSSTPADSTRTATPSTPTKGVRMEQEVKSSAEVPRQRFESELNASLIERRRKVVEEVEQRVGHVNSLLNMPCHFKLTF